MAIDSSGYSKSRPAGSEIISSGDDLLRSDKSILEAALNDEHYFTPQTSASSLSGGVHREGSARVFSGTRASLATPSSADSKGRLYFATDTESLHFIGQSSTTTIVGVRAHDGLFAFHNGPLTYTGNNWSAVSNQRFAVFTFADGRSWGTDPGSGYTDFFRAPSGISGRQLITASMQYENQGAASSWTGGVSLVLLVNGGVLAEQSTHHEGSRRTHGISVSALYQLAAGDNIAVSWRIDEQSGSGVTFDRADLNIITVR